ncbi:hypothetical protein JHK85_027063 [Glycine max]|uniref:HAUS augmin-like complex subunit 3 N-terminal domain-containing protein n=1 Tax=Glycine max TaxID=3847 RepID=A0A0R0IKK0_SOYBN|nr:hypothetical protein JHK87_040883 [Glycine soja]KAG5008521.1 hypothetical protein JHK85_027063 [Glycine max]KAG5014309.1 hypothetical protein JHK86_026570 [Glycine max]
MNGVLERIASKAHELAHYHSGDEDGIYLAYSDFNQFLLGDSSCLKELNQWFAKQLDTFFFCPVYSSVLTLHASEPVDER